MLARQVVADDALTDLHRRVWGALDGVPDAVPTTIRGEPANRAKAAPIRRAASSSSSVP